MKAREKSAERRKAIRLIVGGVLLIAAGAVGLAIPFIGFTTAQDWSRLDEQAKAAVVAAQQANPSATATPLPTPDTIHADITDRLLIPKIKVDMPLVAGDTADALLKGGWLFPGTVRPGRAGNSVVFGHRFRYLPPVSNTFFHLDEVAVGDTFIARYGGTDFVYRVTGIRTVVPTDFSILEAQGDKKLMTLVTCAPAFATTYRLVVTGELVE